MIKDKFIAHVTYSIFLDPPDETRQFTKENYFCLHLYPNSSHAREELHGNVSSHLFFENIFRLCINQGEMEVPS